MKYIRYSLNRIPMVLLPHTISISSIRTTDVRLLRVDGTLREYTVGAVIVNTPEQKWVYGSYNIIRKVIGSDYSDYNKASGTTLELLDMFSRITTGIKGKLIRVRQRGPQKGHCYYVNGNTPLHEYTGRKHEDIVTTSVQLQTHSKHTIRHYVTHANDTGFQHEREIYAYENVDTVPVRKTHVFGKWIRRIMHYAKQQTLFGNNCPRPV